MSDNSWNLDKADKIKAIKVLLHKNSEELAVISYLCSISDIIFSAHASEMRFGDAIYFRGTGKNIKATVVPTLTLSALPRRYRKPHWFYVQIYCHPDDTRFDVFPGFQIIDARQYRI